MLTCFIILISIAIFILLYCRKRVGERRTYKEGMYHLINGVLLFLSLALFFAIIWCMVCAAEIIFEDEIVEYKQEYETLNAELEQELTILLNDYFQSQGKNMYVDSKETVKVIKLYHELMKDPVINIKVQLYESNAKQLASLNNINIQRNKWLLYFAT